MPGKQPKNEKLQSREGDDKDRIDFADNDENPEEDDFDGEEEGEDNYEEDEEGEAEYGEEGEDDQEEGPDYDLKDDAQKSKPEKKKGKKEEINNTLLYDIMGLKQEATPEEIKKAYRKLALLKHPDKNPDDKAAVDNFQKLQKAYQVLSDPKKRERYDQWGDDGTDTFNSKEWMNAYEYYRELHPEISKDDFDQYIEKFRGSKEEEQDLIKFFETSKGDMRGLLENIIGSRNEDIPRYKEIFENLFKEKVLEKNAKWTQTIGKVRNLPDELKEAQKIKKKMEKAKETRAKASGKNPEAPGSMADLQKMILAKRDNAFGKLLNYMEDKYKDVPDEEFGGKSKNLKNGRKRAKKQDEMPDVMNPMDGKKRKVEK